MPNEAPFDVWDGEDLRTEEISEEHSIEEIAMHLDPESLVHPEPGPYWSDLTDRPADEVKDDGPVSYFSDEQPEAEPIVVLADDDREEEGEPDLEELLERQHYAFPADIVTADD